MWDEYRNAVIDPGGSLRGRRERAIMSPLRSQRLRERTRPRASFTFDGVKEAKKKSLAPPARRQIGIRLVDLRTLS